MQTAPAHELLPETQAAQGAALSMLSTPGIIDNLQSQFEQQGQVSTAIHTPPPPQLRPASLLHCRALLLKPRMQQGVQTPIAA
jgi:hypothetical protein